MQLGADSASDQVFNNGEAVGLYMHLLTTLLRINVPAGPWSEDQRWRQAQGALEELWQTERPQRHEVFQEFLGEMLEEPGGQDPLGEDRRGRPSLGMVANKQSFHEQRYEVRVGTLS